MFTLDSNANEEISVERSLVNAPNWLKPEKKIKRKKQEKYQTKNHK